MFLFVIFGQRTVQREDKLSGECNNNIRARNHVGSVEGRGLICMFQQKRHNQCIANLALTPPASVSYPMELLAGSD